MQIEHIKAVRNIESILDVTGHRRRVRRAEHTPQLAKTYMEQGCRVIGLCTDYIMLARTAAEYSRAVR